MGLLGRDSRLGGMILDSNAIALEHFPTIEESLHYFDEIPSLQNNPNAQPVKNARPYKLLLAINGLIAAAILGGYLWRKKNTPGE